MNLTRVPVLLKEYYKMREEQGIDSVPKGGFIMIGMEFKFA